MSWNSSVRVGKSLSCVFTEDDSALTKGGGSCQTPGTLQIFADLNHFSSSNKPRSADSSALVIVHHRTSVLIGYSGLFVQPKTHVTFWKGLIRGKDARKPSTFGSAGRQEGFRFVKQQHDDLVGADCNTPQNLAALSHSVSQRPRHLPRFKLIPPTELWDGLLCDGHTRHTAASDYSQINSFRWRMLLWCLEVFIITRKQWKAMTFKNPEAKSFIFLQ